MTASPAIKAALPDSTSKAGSLAREAIQAVLLRVGAMVENHPEIVEFDSEVAIDAAGQAQVQEARGRVKTGPVPAPISSLRT
jgi:hypothetical protein